MTNTTSCVVLLLLAAGCGHPTVGEKQSPLAACAFDEAGSGVCVLCPGVPCGQPGCNWASGEACLIGDPVITDYKGDLNRYDAVMTTDASGNPVQQTCATPGLLSPPQPGAPGYVCAQAKADVGTTINRLWRIVPFGDTGDIQKKSGGGDVLAETENGQCVCDPANSTGPGPTTYKWLTFWNGTRRPDFTAASYAYAHPSAPGPYAVADASGNLDSNVSEGFVPHAPIDLDTTGGVVSWALGPHDQGDQSASYPDATLYHLRGAANGQACGSNADCQSGHCNANVCTSAGKGDWCTPSSGRFGSPGVCGAGFSCQQYFSSDSADGYNWICS